MILAELLKIYGNHPIPDQTRFFNTFKPPYVVQPKLDGMRVFLIVAKDRSIIVNRRGFWRKFQANGLPEGIYDGELIGVEEGPQFIFKNPTLTIFDIVEPYGDLPLTQRLKKLEAIINESSQIKLIESYRTLSREEALKIAKQLIQEGHEGAVIKANTPYQHPNSWLKIKRKETIDLVILAIKKTESLLEHGIPESFMVGKIINGKPIKITDVCSGLSKEEKKNLLKHLKPTHEDDQYIYVTPSIVLEIEYQQKLKNGLRHPRIVRIRWDK